MFDVMFCSIWSQVMHIIVCHLNICFLLAKGMEFYPEGQINPTFGEYSANMVLK